MGCYKFERDMSRDDILYMYGRIRRIVFTYWDITFKLKATIKAGFTKKVFTDVACTWNQDFMKITKPDKIANIKIYSQKAIGNFKKSKPKTILFSGTHTKLQNEKIDLFLSRFSKFECKPVNLHYYSEHCHTFFSKV